MTVRVAAINETHPTTSMLGKQVQKHLATKTFGRALRTFDRVNSTNTLAVAWAEAQAAEGSVVVAQYQYKGRGRLGRRWHAAPGKNLIFSVVLRPHLDPALLGLITLAASLAVADAIDAIATPLKASIKWPNDILLHRRKCCGMLLESTISQGSPPAVVLGIGLNVNQESFPSELEQQATSLLLEIGRPIPRAPLLASCLQRLEHRYTVLKRDPAAICDAYTRRMHGRGQRLHVGGPQPVTGIALGITHSGALKLQTESGEYIVHAGDTLLETAST